MLLNADPNFSADSALPYELDYIPNDLQRRAKTEMFEDEDTKINSLRLLRSMLKDETDLLWPDDELFLLAFLRTRKYDVKQAFNLMKAFYTVVKKHHDLYFHFNYEDVRRALEENSFGFLPYRDSTGCVILILRVGAWNPQVNRPRDVMRVMTCALLHAIRSPANQIAGFQTIVDFAGCSLLKLLTISPVYLWYFAEALHKCFPGRHRACHMINEGYIICYLWPIIKQFISKKMQDRFYFHGKNIKKLHNYFSPSILPMEYGGDLPPFDNREWASKMEKSSAHLSYIFSHGYRKQHSSSHEKHSKPSTSVS